MANLGYLSASMLLAIDLIRLTRAPSICGRFQLLAWAFCTAATVINYLCESPAHTNTLLSLHTTHIPTHTLHTYPHMAHVHLTPHTSHIYYPYPYTQPPLSPSHMHHTHTLTPPQSTPPSYHRRTLQCESPTRTPTLWKYETQRRSSEPLLPTTLYPPYVSHYIMLHISHTSHYGRTIFQNVLHVQFINVHMSKISLCLAVPYTQRCSNSLLETHNYIIRVVCVVDRLAVCRQKGWRYSPGC